MWRLARHLETYSIIIELALITYENLKTPFVFPSPASAYKAALPPFFHSSQAALHLFSQQSSSLPSLPDCFLFCQQPSQAISYFPAYPISVFSASQFPFFPKPMSVFSKAYVRFSASPLHLFHKTISAFPQAYFLAPILLQTFPQAYS